MKTVVEKLRTIVSLEYKFDDNSEGCQVPGLLVDDWAEVMTLLWQAYFGDILEYEDVVDVIMACKAEGMDQE